MDSGELESVHISDLLASDNGDISWLINNILPPESVGILAGPAGHGKSWMLFDLAVEYAHGGKWLGHFATSGGRVLYIDEESSQALVCRRLRKLLTAKGLEDPRLDLYFLIGRGICFNGQDSVAQIRRLLERQRPDLVIIDSLIRVNRAEENSATEMSRMFAVVKDLVRCYGCSILFADHQRKPGQTRMSSDQLLRGSTEKAAFVDTLLSLRRKDSQIIVEHSKSRFAEPVSSFVVTIEDTGQDATTVTYKGDAEAVKQAERLETATDFLFERLSSDEWVSRPELLAGANEARISRNLIDDALKHLYDEGQIDKDHRSRESGRGEKVTIFRLRAE